ncbi:MAG TPA: cobyrinate a,c-diamide synthase [Acidimicrobiales bacterium]|nr:cobyrinate a,c-diamide synthase [Acidimicrobiales bacterium]
MPSPSLGPRLVIAGTHSGAGKTTVATGLLAALRAAGERPAGAKVGPDFIDPGYHAVACGRPPRNLDPWLCGEESILPLAARAGDGAGVLVVEGVMGMFDGSSDGTPSSTADVARLLGAPIVLVVDASAMSGSIAAMVHGYASFDPTVTVGGVILNQVGSEGHATLLREALEPLGIPVLGALPRDDRLTWRDRHLGLVPVVEHRAEVDESIRALAAIVSEHVDLAAIVRMAQGAATVNTAPVALPAGGPRFRVAVAGGRAFSFTYTDTLDALEAAGAEVVPFDPLQDETLPEGVDGALIGGGFPEVHAGELSANHRLLADLRRRVDSGLPLWAECGGLLLLAEELNGHRMAGVVAGAASLTSRLTLGYREAVTRAESPIGPPRTRFRGHEFHYSTVDPPGDALELSSRWGTRLEGWATPSLLATYVHHHPGGDPRAVESFSRRCALRRTLRLA